MRQETGRAGVDTFAGAAETGQVWPGVNDPPLTLVARLNWTISRCPGFEGVAQLWLWQVRCDCHFPIRIELRINRPCAAWYWQLRETTTRFRTARALETTSTSRISPRDSRFDTRTPAFRPRQRPYCLARAAGEAADRRSAGEGQRPRSSGSLLEALSPLTRRAARADLSPLRGARHYGPRAVASTFSTLTGAADVV